MYLKFKSKISSNDVLKFINLSRFGELEKLENGLDGQEEAEEFHIDNGENYKNNNGTSNFFFKKKSIQKCFWVLSNSTIRMLDTLVRKFLKKLK